MNPERLVPTGELLATAATAFDFRTPRPIGEAVLDECFTDLERDDADTAHVDLERSRIRPKRDTLDGRQVSLRAGLHW